MRRGRTRAEQRVVAGIARLLASLSLAAAAAGQQMPARPPSPDAEAAAITRVVMSAELAAWARMRGDAQALLVAARVLDEIRVRPQSGEAPFLTADALVREAESLAPEDSAVRAEILRLRNRHKGVRASAFGPGPIVIVRRVPARETFGFEVEARPNEVLRVAAIGDGDTNIDLVLRERDGTVLCSDSSLDHYPVCTLGRPRGGPVRIEVVNRGAVWSRVQILTN